MTSLRLSDEPIDQTAAADNIPASQEFSARIELLRPLGAGRYGTAYLGVDRALGEPVELRRLSTTLSPDLLDEIAARVRLIGLLRHPSVRAVREHTTDSLEPTIILDHGGDTTLEQFASSRGDAKTLLKAVHQVAEGLAEAHHFGLTHGALSPNTIGVVDGAPRLDLTGFLAGSESSADPTSFGTPEAKAVDCRSLTLLVAWALEQPGVEAVCREVSSRDAARLRQLGSRRNEATTELADAQALADCLGRLAQPSDPEPVTEPVADTTSEVVVAPPVDSDATADVPAFDLASNGAAEVGLAGRPAASDALRREPREGDLLGRFRIERKLGEGGMGAVFKAIDIGVDRPVAIKVLSQRAMLRGNAVRRFAKEARLLASLNNPHITNLIDVSEEDGLHYIALEYVDGVDVSRVLERHGTLTERAGLAIAADVARALVDAHQREIVHRDIKPENILLVGCDGVAALGETPPRAKLADFGIARHIDQSESLAVTQAGSLLGTPKYMSPEQCRGQGEVMPQSDVYALGVTLFELLTGEAPFVADDPMALAGKHCFDAPPALRKAAPHVSEPTAELVAKCLAKRPEDRYADAGALLRAIDRLLRGEPSQVALRPVLPDHDPTRVVGAIYEWSLDAAPEALWPYVSNTERLNRAIGLPPVEYRTEQDPERGVRRFGTIRLAGFSMTWEEHPFEWIEGRRMSVLREFQSGPFRWFVSTVELLPAAESGCQLRHTVKILPRNPMGSVVARLETGGKCRRSLEKVYRRIDGTLTNQSASIHRDAFEAQPRLKAHQRNRLIAGAAALEATGVDAAVVESLNTFLQEAPDQEVAKIRPVALARRLDLDEDATLDACLRATQQGLLSLQWDLLCPTCRVPADTRASLKEIESHTRCEACDYDFRSNVAGAVELVFRVHPEVRDMTLGKYCVGGPWHAPHVVAQLRLEPGERVEAELALTPGEYLIRGPRLSRNYAVRVVGSGAPSSHEFLLRAGDESERTFVLRSGGQTIGLENRFECQQVVRIERTIPRDDVLTAARASATPRFRELFPEEVFSSGRLVSAEQVTMLTAAVPTIDAVYLDRGDAEAFTLVERHIDETSATIREHGGDVVKVIGEAVVASFHSASRAVEAAFALNRTADRPLPLAIGVHRGPALVTTSNNRLDYFGATARQATALPNLVGPGVALTEPVTSDPAAAELITGRTPAGVIRSIDLPGRPGQLIQFFECEHPT